jgi:hypothetical protein
MCGTLSLEHLLFTLRENYRLLRQHALLFAISIAIFLILNTHTHTHTHTNVNTYIGSTQCDFCPSNSWSSRSSVAKADCLCQAGYSGLFVQLNELHVRVCRRTAQDQETSSAISLSRSLSLSLSLSVSLPLSLSLSGRNGAGR